MTEQEVQAFCQNSGVSVSPPGEPLRVLDPTELPASVRAFVNNDGTYKGDNTPETEDASHEDSKGEPDADENAVRKLPTDSKGAVEKREAGLKHEKKSKK